MGRGSRIERVSKNSAKILGIVLESWCRNDNGAAMIANYASISLLLL